MSLPKPYPPTPINYEDWNTLIDALEARFGPSAAGFIQDRTRIINSRGNIWEKVTGNIQLAIEDVLSNGGGAVWLPKGKITETSGWVVDEEKPVYIHGAGMCWHGLDRGTMVEFALSSGVHCIDFDAPGTIHFGDLYDMTLYPVSARALIKKLSMLLTVHTIKTMQPRSQAIGEYRETPATSSRSGRGRSSAFTSYTRASP